MLELHFINVGDGDAALIEERTGQRVFRLLIDAGNSDVDPSPGFCRLTAGEYLRARGIDKIDALVVTHLHGDHFMGLEGLVEQVRFERVWSGFFPPCPEQRAACGDFAPKTVRALADGLGRWCAVVEALRGKGTVLHPVWESLPPIPLTGMLQMELKCPDKALCAVQRQIWAAMLAGERVPEGMIYWSSKFRNSGSLRAAVAYAGRRVEIPGDCYGGIWEGEAVPCDILKVPHHGDRKALTAPLLERLRPSWAVISCAAGYIPRKDRPSAHTLELLRRAGTRVWFTDCFEAPGQEKNDWTSVDFTITEDGNVLTPDGHISGGR